MIRIQYLMGLTLLMIK